MSGHDRRYTISLARVADGADEATAEIGADDLAAIEFDVFDNNDDSSLFGSRHLSAATVVDVLMATDETEYSNPVARLAKAEEGGAFATEESRIYMAQRESMRAALSAVIGVALDCQQRWSRGHPAIVEHAQKVMADMDLRDDLPLVSREKLAGAEQQVAALVDLIDDRDDEDELGAVTDAARAVALRYVDVDSKEMRALIIDSAGGFEGEPWVEKHADEAIAAFKAKRKRGAT